MIHAGAAQLLVRLIENQLIYKTEKYAFDFCPLSSDTSTDSRNVLKRLLF